MLAHKLASAYPEVFAGFAAVAGTIGTNKQQLDPKGPVPALLMHGERDRIIPIGGGTGKNFPDFVWKSFADTVASWKQANNCEEHVERRDEKNRTAIYAQCSAPLATVIFEKDGHEWHDWRLLNFWHQRPEGSRRVADFFNSLQAGRQAANPSANE
jgi:poly(3-hydroxybutyrate) depolymerase